VLCYSVLCDIRCYFILRYFALGTFLCVRVRVPLLCVVLLRPLIPLCHTAPCLMSHLHSTVIKLASQFGRLLSLIDSLFTSTTECAVLHGPLRAVNCLSHSQCACPYLQQLSLPPGGQQTHCSISVHSQLLFMLSLEQNCLQTLRV